MPLLKRRKLNRSRKKIPKSPSQQSQNIDTDREWAAREILAESSAEYLIDWEPNSDTGEKYSPTWEPKRNASKSLIRSWRQDRLSQSSFTAGFSSYSSLGSTKTQQKDIFGESRSGSVSSSHRNCKRDRQRRQVTGHNKKLELNKLPTQRKRKHICSSTEDSDSETVKAVDLTSHSPDSERIQGSGLVSFEYTSIQPSSEVEVLDGGLRDSCSQLSGRQDTLASQLIESSSTCFVDSFASLSTELASRERPFTLSTNIQSDLYKSVTPAPNPNSVCSYRLHKNLNEIPESWEDENSRKFTIDSLNLRACAAEPSGGKAGGRDHNSVSEKQALSEETSLLAFAESECAQDVRCSLNSCVIGQSITDLPIPLNSRTSHPSQEYSSLKPPDTQSYIKLDSSNISNAATRDLVSSTTSEEILNTSPFSLNEEIDEELRSSVSRSEFTPVSSDCEADAAATIDGNLNPPITSTSNSVKKNLTQDSCFHDDNTTSQNHRRSSFHQTRPLSTYSQKESFESTFETLSALASSYVTPEPGNLAFTNDPTCERLAASSATEVLQGYRARSLSSSSYTYPQFQTSSTFGEKPSILVLAPSLLSNLQNSARSSGSEDISTPFKTQISISRHSLHTTERNLADFKYNEKAKVWEQYILKKFGISTSDKPNHYKDRVLNLLRLLSTSEGISYWKANAIILFFVAINPHTQKDCTRDITLLARELYKTTCGRTDNISSAENKGVSAKLVFVEQDDFERLNQKHNFPLTMDREYQMTLDNPTLQQQGRVMAVNTPPSVEMKDKESLSIAHDKSLQSFVDSVGDSEVTDVLASISLTEPLLEEEEYIFPLPMQGTTAQQYRDIIPYYNTNIRRFTSKKRQKAKLELKPVKRLIEHLNNITYHVDLENDRAFTQENVSKSIQAKWDETCSSKFRVLGALFDDLKDKTMHIAVTLRSGKPVIILENWLKSKKIPFFNASKGGKTGKANEPVADRLFVTVIPDEINNVIDNMSGIDAIFALDCSFTENRERIRELQAKSNVAYRLAPIISFIIFASQEHISRCIPVSLNEIENLQVLASYVSSWRLNAGKLPNEAREIIDCTSLVSDWLLARIGPGRAQNPELDAMDWPLPLIDKTNNGIPAENLHLASFPKDVHHSLKRSNDQIDEVERSKRMRVSSQFPSDRHNDVSITHISETNLASSQQNQNIEQQASFGRKKSSHPHEYVDTKIVLLKEQLQFAQEKVKDLESASEDIQRRYNKQRSDIAKLEEENKQLRSTSEQEKNNNMELARTVDHAFVEMQNLQEQEKQNEAHITKTELTEVLSIEVQLRELREERDKLKKKVKKQDEELDFIRERYREASDAAMKSTQQMTSTENALRDAQRRASGEATRLKQMHYSNYTSRLEDENKLLKAFNENLTDLLRRKDDELRSLRARTILSTRATSVPRSPRFGPSGSGSRAGSPPTPKPHHPLRTS